MPPDARSQCRTLATACERERCLAEEEVREFSKDLGEKPCKAAAELRIVSLLARMKSAVAHCKDTSYEAALQKQLNYFYSACPGSEKLSTLPEGPAVQPPAQLGSLNFGP